MWKDLKLPFYNVRLLPIYLLPIVEIKSTHAELLIWYVTFDFLHNGQKNIEKGNFLLRWHHSYTVRSRVNSLKVKDLEFFSVFLIHENFYLGEIRTSSRAEQRRQVSRKMKKKISTCFTSEEDHENFEKMVFCVIE